MSPGDLAERGSAPAHTHYEREKREDCLQRNLRHCVSWASRKQGTHVERDHYLPTRDDWGSTSGLAHRSSCARQRELRGGGLTLPRRVGGVQQDEGRQADQERWSAGPD